MLKNHIDVLLFIYYYQFMNSEVNCNNQIYKELNRLIADID